MLLPFVFSSQYIQVWLATTYTWKHPGAPSDMTKSRISLVVFQINWLQCSFPFSYPDILCVYPKYMLRTVSTAKGQLADPVLCVNNPYHHLQQVNEQHQLKGTTAVVGFFNSHLHSLHPVEEKSKGCFSNWHPRKGNKTSLKASLVKKRYLQVHYCWRIVILSCSLQSQSEISHGLTTNTLKVQMGIQNVWYLS